MGPDDGGISVRAIRLGCKSKTFTAYHCSRVNDTILAYFRMFINLCSCIYYSVVAQFYIIAYISVWKNLYVIAQCTALAYVGKRAYIYMLALCYVFAYKTWLLYTSFCL